MKCIICNSKKHCDECKEKKKADVKQKTSLKKISESHMKYPNGTDPYTFVECVVCSLRSPDISRHVSYMHGITNEEYKKNHGPTMSESKLDTFRGENNPGFNHSGRLSPFSKKFVNYTSDEAIHELHKRAAQTAIDNNNNSTRLDYYTSRGCSDEEAKKLLSERQTTFTLEKCIERHGEVEGYKVWKERQDIWQESMKDKPSEEIARINALKSSKYSFENLWNNEMTDPGNFYILEIVQGTYKIGITIRETIEKRYGFLKNKNNKIKVKLFQKMEDISHAFRVEQLVKRKFLHTITNEDYDMKDKIGWTEVVRVDYDTVLNEANKYIKDVELSITDFNNIRKKPRESNGK